jgi:hypothetical protein
MTSNPLIAKYEELYGKKEEPKPQKTHTDKLKELRDISTVPVNTPNITTKANPMLSLTSYDYDSSFLQTAEKVEKGQAKVSCVSVERDIYTGTKITFEVWTN